VKSHLDNWLKYVAFYFDLSYDESRRLAAEAGYADRLLDRVSGMDPMVLSALRAALMRF